jgi:uncharacterized membrane protein (TIGR02234 family)
VRDRTFVPTVLLGLAGAGLAAVAASHEWARTDGRAAGVKVTAGATGSEAAPLVLALALVALAAWGVVLVLRGRARQVVAVVGLVAAGGAFAALVQGHRAAEEASLQAVLAQGAGSDVFVTSVTGWYWTAGLALLLTTAALAVAVRKAPAWPAMGSRYDAPAARSAAPVTDQDLWRSLDEGHDPTA